MFTDNNRNKQFDENSGCKISTGLNEKKILIKCFTTETKTVTSMSL